MAGQEPMGSGAGTLWISVMADTARWRRTALAIGETGWGRSARFFEERLPEMKRRYLAIVITQIMDVETEEYLDLRSFYGIHPEDRQENTRTLVENPVSVKK